MLVGGAARAATIAAVLASTSAIWALRRRAFSKRMSSSDTRFGDSALGAAIEA